MFDNPKKELRELEDQLLAAEMNHKIAELNKEEFEELYDGILEEFGPALEQNGSPSDPPIRNFANGYGKGAPAAAAPAHQPVEAPPVRRKGVRGLLIAICLELLAIAGLTAYWYLNGYAVVLTVLLYQLTQ